MSGMPGMKMLKKRGGKKSLRKMRGGEMIDGENVPEMKFQGCSKGDVAVFSVMYLEDDDYAKYGYDEDKEILVLNPSVNFSEKGADADCSKDCAMHIHFQMVKDAGQIDFAGVEGSLDPVILKGVTKGVFPGVEYFIEVMKKSTDGEGDDGEEEWLVELRNSSHKLARAGTNDEDCRDSEDEEDDEDDEDDEGEDASAAPELMMPQPDGADGAGNPYAGGRKGKKRSSKKRSSKKPVSKKRKGGKRKSQKSKKAVKSRKSKKSRKTRKSKK